MLNDFFKIQMNGNTRTYQIATGKSRFERRWHNEAVTWQWLRDRLREPVVTGETMADYRKMGRDRQTEIKDVGGFVGGYLDDGLRKATAVRCRTLLTLDYDEFDALHLERVRKALSRKLWLMHSTHKHTAENWRVRLVIATDRSMTPDEYGAVARKIAQDCGFDGIDRTTFEPCRLMFWSSRSVDSPFLFEEGEGEPLGVAETLRRYTDWRDMSSWPLLPDEEAGSLFGNAATGERDAGGMMTTAFGKQEDPRVKGGIIGTFCRCYDVEEAISAFIPAIYTRSGRNRYTHTGSSTTGGGWVIEEGRFFYSFHSTDPCQGMLLNSWDLVRLHLFGALDSTAERGTRTARLPSTKRMETLAGNDPKVRLMQLEERRKQAAADFAGIEPGEEPAGEDPVETEWKRILSEKLTFRNGAVVSTSTNIALILANEPSLKGRIRLNDFTRCIDVVGDLPWRRSSRSWDNNDDACLRLWLDRLFGISGKDKIADALQGVANDNGYHPVREYLAGLEWDGVKRVEGLFTDVLGAEHTRLNRELARLLLRGAVGRVLHPGCKFDFFIILYGPEGTGKSSLFSLLAGQDWFSDSVCSIEGKEGMESIQGKWIVEMGELSGTKRSDVEGLKQFISRQSDDYRPAYGRRQEQRARQCVIVGTTNEELFLRGITTGNRRQPVVEIKPELRTVDEPVRAYVAKWRDQIWAEAVEMYKADSELILPVDLTEEVKRIQDLHNLDKTNPLFPEVDQFLDLCLPVNWDEEIYRNVESRIKWLHTGVRYQDETFGYVRRRKVCVAEILQELFELRRTDKEYLSRSREIGQYLNSLKDRWKFIGPRRHKIYGNQKTWERIGDIAEDVNRDELDAL